MRGTFANVSYRLLNLLLSCFHPLTVIETLYKKFHLLSNAGGCHVMNGITTLCLQQLVDRSIKVGNGEMAEWLWRCVQVN
jgi:hypothetical protein